MSLIELKSKILDFFGLNKSKQELKKEAKKTAKFFMAFLVIFIVLLAILSLVPLIYWEFITIIPVQFLLSMQGINSNIQLQEPLLLQLETGQTIIISYLCTGLLELILIVSLIIGSIGIPLKKRLIGVFLSIPLTYAFNVARITITINAIINIDEKIVDLIHGILFRITLFIVIVGIYYAWFYWATKEQKLKYMLIK